MKIYVDLIDSNKKISSFGYRELASKMWYKEKNGKELEISRMGNDEALRDNIFSHLSNDKWLNDERWSAVSSPLYREHIEMEKVKGTNFLEFGTTHVDILTVDKRALYIMVREVVEEVGGLISEDGMATWITLDEFIERHQDILNLSYDEANEVSLKEAETMEAVEEPWEWYEDDEVDD